MSVVEARVNFEKESSAQAEMKSKRKQAGMRGGCVAFLPHRQTTMKTQDKQTKQESSADYAVSAFAIPYGVKNV